MPATVYKKGNSPFYHAEIWIDGNRFSRSTKRTSRREAESRAGEIEDELRAELKKQGASQTSLAMEDVANRYMDQRGDKHVGADNTLRLVNWLLTYYGPTKLITDIRTGDVRTMRDKRAQDRVGSKGAGPFISNATVNDTTEQLKKLFTFLKVDEHVTFEHEPAWRDLWLKVVEEHPRQLSEDEEDRFYREAMKRPDYLPLILFMHSTGKRKTNCFTLPWTEVNWDRSTIAMIVKYPDGGKKVIFEINPSLRAILLPLYEARHENCGVPEAADRVFTFTGQRTMDKVIKGKRQHFVAGLRYPITKDGLRRTWNTIIRHAGLTGASNFRPHDLRHDFASKLLASVPTAVGVRIIQQALDHAPGSNTWQKYAHANDRATASAVEALAAARLQKRMRTTAETATDVDRDANHRTNHRSNRAG
jgi:integrase